MTTKKTEAATKILADGGQFVRRLERNGYTGREQFCYRLLDRNHNVIKGYGFQTFEALRSMLAIAGGGTSVSTYYRLRGL